MTANGSRWLTAQEAADVLQIHVSTLRAVLRRNDDYLDRARTVRVLRIGGQIRVPAGALDGFNSEHDAHMAVATGPAVPSVAGNSSHEGRPSGRPDQSHGDIPRCLRRGAGQDIPAVGVSPATSPAVGCIGVALADSAVGQSTQRGQEGAAME